MSSLLVALGLRKAPPKVPIGPFRSIPLNAHLPRHASLASLSALPGSSGAPGSGPSGAAGTTPEDRAKAEVVAWDADFAGNEISTARYTSRNFFFKNLIEQFSRVANSYFAVIVILASLPISPVSPWSSLAPLLIVLLVTMLKDGLDDLYRHKSDKEINSRTVKVVRDGKVSRELWSNLKVGDICLCGHKELVPADMVFLASSDDQDICFVETSQLDGETNLKVRDALPATAYVKKPEEASALKGMLESEHPNPDLYTYKGRLRLLGGVDGLEEVTISIENLLLRGVEIRNTEWVYGLVVFTGIDTKLIRNSTEAPTKVSIVEHSMNKQLLQLFALQAVACIVSAILGVVFEVSEASKMSHLRGTGSTLTVVENAVLGYLIFLIIYNVMIPISLYVSLELARAYHAILINSDKNMYYAHNNTPAKVRSSSLSDELGQVEYIFSDKTGTLTQNLMVFRQCYINGTAYGEIEPGAPDGLFNPDVPSDPAFDFLDPTLRQNLDKTGSPDAAMIDEFLTCLATCHSVILDTGDDVPIDEATGQRVLRYQASSPDENALVSAARYLGYEFNGRGPSSVSVSIFDRPVEFEILNVIEFNSTRKRMSVVVRKPDGTVVLYCKGADSVIYERLDRGASAYLDETTAQLQHYASIGLRTLCLSYRVLSPAEYDRFSKTWHEASVMLDGRDEALDAVAEEWETNLILIGATAIEDKLQDGVPEAIATLAKGGLKIWVLTGDKQETAINIGFSCKLLTAEQDLLIVNGESAGQVEDILNGFLEQLTAEGVRNSSEPLALVIDGGSLAYALDRSVETTFLKLAKLCQAVVCCRVSPLQKSLVVGLVKNNEAAITLAIGDGANDVSMIQAAHIGVGISGFEGMQAVLASDYAVAQFRFLKDLLLIHGRWNLSRVKRLILYSFYKNMALAMIQFWFALNSGFSGATFFDQYLPTSFNTIATSFPILGIAILEQDVSKEAVRRFPRLFTKPRTANTEFRTTQLWAWLASGIYVSVLCYLIPVSSITHGWEPHLDAGMFATSTASYICLVFAVSAKIALMTHYWTGWTAFFLGGSLISIMAFLSLYSTLATGFQLQVAQALFASGTFWIVLLIVTVAAVLPDLAWMWWRRSLRSPRPAVVVQEMFKFEKEVSPEAPRPGLVVATPKASRPPSAMSPGKAYTGFAFSADDAKQWSVITGVHGAAKKWKRKQESRKRLEAKRMAGEDPGAGTGLHSPPGGEPPPKAEHVAPTPTSP